MSTRARSRVWAMSRRNLLVQSRDPGHWFLLLILPLVDGLLFGSIGVAFGEGEAPVRLLVTGIMMFHLIWQLTLAGSFGLLEEVWSRNLLNLMTTPLTEREFLGGIGVVGLIRTAISVTVIALVGLVFYAVAPDSAGWVLIPSAALLLLFGWAIALFVIGLTLQYGDSAEVFSWGTLVLLLPLSGVFYPVESLPPVLQPIAEVIPLTSIFQSVQYGLETGSIAWGELGWAALGTAIALALGVVFLDWQMRRFRRLGWITKFT
ncbi:MAG: ABC transporter permease [Actinomycetia bacterium]|nr:ABC transporter permease [Actinomycetes bacterium]